MSQRTASPRRALAVSGGFIVLLGLVAILAPMLTRYDPFAISPAALRGPEASHWLGTDNIGRDVFSGMLYGTRPTLAVGFAAALLSATVGVGVGALSGYYTGVVDKVLVRVTEFFQMWPVFFLALVIITLTGPGLPKVILVIGLASWPNIARLVRVGFLRLRRAEFVEAAQTVGCTDWRLIARHILPNAVAPAVVAASFTVGRAMLTEAGLSFFGLGDPRFVSWGQMLNNAQQFLLNAWWLAAFPGLALVLTVLAVNSAADSLNDVLDPR
jgi:peptide/nickel transport system permease protein